MLTVNERKADPEILEDAKWILRSRGQRRTWKVVEKTALDRRAWKDMVVGLCLEGAKRRRREDYISPS
jgi:hypothetical protein